MSKLWSGRFKESSSQLLDEFNASIGFDYLLWKQDIIGSIAHAKMLNKIGILSYGELAAIIGGLKKIAHMIENDEFDFKIEDEDIHMAIEKALTKDIGDTGKKLHTARSRNDQVALDFRMYVLDANLQLQDLLLSLLHTFLNLAKYHTDTIMPGFTHLQHAQPVSFAFHIMAWSAMIRRDVQRLEFSYKRNDFCPLGAGALAGTPYGNDRVFVASELGFEAPTMNAMDSVSDRDFALDFLYDVSVIMMHISRMSEELVFWSTSEFGFITLSDAYSTGSSIMPQKKNPDVPELLRGKSGRTFGNLLTLLSVMKGLPLAYNKDMQEDKECVFDSFKNAQISVKILKACVQTMQVNTDAMDKSTKKGHISATDLADFLVRKCAISFREAHHITGSIVALAEQKKTDILELSEEEIMNVDSRIIRGVKEALCLQSSVNSRNSLGGTAKESVDAQILDLQGFLATESKRIEETKMKAKHALSI